MKQRGFIIEQKMEIPRYAERYETTARVRMSGKNEKYRFK